MAKVDGVTDGLMEQALLEAYGSTDLRHVLRRPERAAALRKLRQKGLVRAVAPSTGAGGEHGWLVPTEEGAKAAEVAAALRRQEEKGLPIKEWSPRRQPWGMKAAEFRDWAMFAVTNADGSEVFHSNGHLMLRGPNPDWTDQNAPVGIDGASLLDDEGWTVTAVNPVGYFFQGHVAHIAFDRAGVAVRADYYEIVRGSAAKNEIGGWEALWTGTPGDTVGDTETPARPVMVRLKRGDDGTLLGTIGTVVLETGLPGLAGLITNN